MNLKALQQAAEELNRLILPDPPINETKKKGLKAKLHIAASLLEPYDTISQETATVLEELGIYHRAQMKGEEK